MQIADCLSRNSQRDSEWREDDEEMPAASGGSSRATRQRGADYHSAAVSAAVPQQFCSSSAAAPQQFRSSSSVAAP